MRGTAWITVHERIRMIGERTRPAEGLVSEPSPPGSRAKAILAALLSFLISGAGQLYNRQPRKALVLAIAGPIFILASAATRILLSFPGLVFFLVIAITWKIGITVEAFVARRKSKKPENPLLDSRASTPLVAIVLLAAAFYPSPDDFKRWTGFAAFKIPSASMCPTICVGDRIIADQKAYQDRLPQRGDLIMLKHESSTGLFLKRVIGVAGDTVAPGAGGTVLVNGKPLEPVPGCGGQSFEQTVDSGAYSEFKLTQVLEGTFFVVGDNLGDSFDSRIAAFGPVVPEQVRGRPIFLYWSSDFRRIGCRTR
jgi:signal peptidase I